MSKAKVYRATRYEVELSWPSATERIVWATHHRDCGWREELTEWHNAFWAADHHVRYDCGRREQMSSGSTQEDCVPGHPQWGEWGSEEAWRKAGAPQATVRYDLPPKPEHLAALREATYQENFPLLDWPGSREELAKWKAHYKAQIEGGMQKTPTPTDMGLPLQGRYTEGPTTDLGAITTEVGQVPGDTEGQWVGDQGQGHTTWWPWGRQGR